MVKYFLVGDYLNLLQFIIGIKELVRLLGIFVSMVSRMKVEGLFDDVFFQNGKIVIFDICKVLEILYVSNKKNKFNFKN